MNGPALPPVLLPLLERSARAALVRSGFRTSMVPAPAGRVHVYDAPGSGSLPTAVVLHGISSAASAFAAVLARLRRGGRRVVAIDYPGHGFSDPPAATLTPEALLESTRVVLGHVLGAEPAVLVGNSLGGAVALDYALHRPDDVRALVLLSPAGAASSIEEWAALRGTFTVTSRRGAIAFLERIHHRRSLLGRLIAHEMPAALNRRAVRDLFETASTDHVIPPERLATLRIPILLWWGRSERILPASHLDWWRRHLPTHAVIEEPDGIGHCPHMDAPGRVAERITSFVRASVGS